MQESSLYIFRSSELFLENDNTLPTSFPDISGIPSLDCLDLTLSGKPTRVILLEPALSTAAVVSASVCGPVCVDPRGAPTGDRARLSGAGMPPTGDRARLSGAGLPGHWVRLRDLFASVDPALSALSSPAARALGLINWHNSTRYCSRCGAPLTDHPAEIARVCGGCRITVYPRISPAIIVLVHRDGKILLARHASRNQDVYACLAGFVEHGETLEACVSREVFEETGLTLKNIRYAGSQSWPYPDQFMVAFHADWASGEIRTDPSEILEARWFDPSDLPSVPMPGTVAWRLIHDVLRPGA